MKNTNIWHLLSAVGKATSGVVLQLNDSAVVTGVDCLQLRLDTLVDTLISAPFSKFCMLPCRYFSIRLRSEFRHCLVKV